MSYDLVVAGGRVIDPANEIDDVLDVGIRDGLVAAVGHGLDGAISQLNAHGCLVTPGLIDIHDHFFHGTGYPQRDPRTDLIPTGVTSAADAGSSGSANYVALRDLLIKPAALNLYAWLNIEALGLTSHGYPRAPSLEVANVAEAINVIESNRDTIVGVKVLAPSDGPEAADGCELVRRAVAAAAATGTPVLCHVDGGTDLLAVLDLLRPGDIVTHCFHGHQPNILGGDGAVRPEVWSARERGVLFDVAPCGGYHMAWGVAQAAAQQDFLPDLIGSDFVHLPDGDPSYHITDCMTMMLGLGMPLADVIRAVTAAPARTLGRGRLIGALAPGRSADLTVLTVNEVDVSYQSKLDGPRTFPERLSAVATIVAGKSAWLADAVDGATS